MQLGLLAKPISAILTHRKLASLLLLLAGSINRVPEKSRLMPLLHRLYSVANIPGMHQESPKVQL
jgi:hypothetical protein